MSDAERQDETELALDEALEVAARAHQAGDFSVAAALYGRILSVSPDHAGALHLFGVLHHQTNRPREAIALIRRAITLDPDDASMHSNLGNVLFEIDRPDLAVQAYGEAIRLDPGNGPARNNLGVALRTLRRPDEAEAVYREAIAIDPANREAWDNLGRLLAGRGSVREAISCHARALELEPRNAATRRFLVAAYAATGETDRAVELLRCWLQDEPDSPSASHLYAAISGENVPDRASDRYVATLFDGFAASFDHKLARLGYRVPDLIAGAVAAAYPAPRSDLAVLDAGCGTGLCGPALRRYAQTLSGIDLSAKMLERAAQRGSYDRLSHGELTAHLAASADAFDLVISADTFCYFGRLEPVFEAAALALRSGGRLIFSVEELTAGGDFALGPHGRFGHARAYVERRLAASGLPIENLTGEVLRMERGEPVGGLIVTAAKPA